MGPRGSFVARTALAVVLIGITCASLMLFLTAATAAQSRSQAPAPEWQKAAGGKMAFETASATQNTSGPPYRVSSNFPLGPGDVYIPTASFRATNFPLAAYIAFAYKIDPDAEQFFISQMPQWAFTDRFDIQATAQGNPTKDQMRLMVQALLADRFRLAVHYETRHVPVFVLLVDQPGKLGPLLQRHPEDLPCSTTPMIPSPPPEAPAQPLDSRFPATCGGMLPMGASLPGRIRGGARNVTMEFIASTFPGGATAVDRPVLDKTGLTGRFDFALEFAPQYGAGLPPTSKFPRDPSGPTFIEAVKQQLGLRLEAQVGPFDVLVVDYAEKPLPN